MRRSPRVTAADQAPALTLYAAPGATITASTVTRTLSGDVVRYGVYGRTSRGRLKVAPGALRFPDDIGRVKLTREHDRAASRGHAVEITDDGTTIRASLRVADGPEGDDALREAADRTRDGFSFDVVDAEVVGDTITSALVIAIGQVGIPAYDDMRIDTIAASQEGTTIMLTTEQLARLAALAARVEAGETLTDDEQAELDALKALAALNANPAPEAVAAAAVPVTASASAAERVEVAASIPPVSPGVPTPLDPPTAGGHAPARTNPQGGAFGQFCVDMAAALASQNVGEISAALSDITYSAHAGNIQQPDWSGELWSGLEYQPEFLDLYTEGTLTSLSGSGWRFTDKMEIADYAGDKAAIPSDTVTTATQTWTGARMAVGVDIDRAFFDFPTAGFVESLFEQVRESWKIKLDGKVKAWTTAQAVAAAEDEWAGIPTAIAAQPTLLKAAAVAVRALKRRRVGTASWVLVSDEDMFTLLDTQVDQVLAYLKLWGIDPEQFRSSSALSAGTVYAGVKQAAKVRTLPGSPIRVDAQHLANGGVDQAFFGYWAIEKQHTRGVAKATFTAPEE